MKLNTFALEGINPLRGLDTPQLVSLIELGERGYYARLQWLYRAIEKRDPVVRAVKKRLVAALGSLEWDIKLEEIDEKDAAKKAMAESQEKTLREAYAAIGNLRAALNFLALGELRGFSHTEKVYAGAINPHTKQPFDAARDPLDVIELRPVEQWFWAKDGHYGPWLYNREARETITGERIDPKDYVIHEVADPADEIFAELVVMRRVNDADWNGFLEDYGIPPMFIGMPPNVPQAREAEYQRTAELAVSAARGALPHGATLQTPSATGSGGAGVFAERLRYLDEQIVVAGTAGKLTVLAESGSGNLAGGAQKEAFDEIAQAIADEISGVMQDQFDKPLLARRHQGEPVLAYFEFAAVDKTDTGAILDDAVKAKNAGYRIDDAELSEKSGYSLTSIEDRVGANAERHPLPSQEMREHERRQSPVISAPASEPTAARRAPDPEKINALLENGLRQIKAAESADLIPLRRAIEDAMTDPTPERLQNLLEQLPGVSDQLGEKSAEALRNVLGTALVSGLTV